MYIYFYIKGNDLSRVLGWGGGFSKSNELIKILQNVFNAEQVSLGTKNNSN